MKLFKQLSIGFCLLVASHHVFSQVKRDTLNVLFVGNSYTFTSNMPHLLSLISDSTTTKLITTKSTSGGASLKDHWEGEKGLKSKSLINTGKFDIVVLQEYSTGTLDHPSDFFNYSKKLCDLIKASGARPYFFVTWAREKVPQHQEIITKAYEQAAQQNEAGLVVVGEAWKLARTLRPGLKLFKPDGSHPSDLGALLTACVFTKAITKQLPKKMQDMFVVKDTIGQNVILLWEDPLDISFCLDIALKMSSN